MTAYVSLKINNAALQKKLNDVLYRSTTVKRLAYTKAYGIYYNAKRMMLKEFDRHDITQEILAGPDGVNISGTLDGYGNLYSFIGFQQGSEPTEALRELLDLGTSFERTVFRNNAWYFRVTMPTKEAIENVTQMPWEHGNSWAFSVEKYISGLSHYMYKENLGGRSRSGSGLQTQEEYLEDVHFSGKPYITEILNNFRDRVNKER